MSTQYHSKEQHTSENTKEFSKDQKHSKEHFKANQGKTDVVVERVQNEPVVVEHHHHHTHTVIHPEVVREHDTTEIRQVVKPVYEHVRAAEREEYAGKDVRVVEKAENTTEAQRKLEAHQRDIQARADVTHTEEKTKSYDNTKVSDVHATHRVIEEVTPVIIRDVVHDKTIHKDEKVVEKIHHAPEVHKEELIDTTKHSGLKEGHTRDTHGYKEEITKEKHRPTGLKEGHTTKGTTGLKEGHTTKGTTTGIKEGHTTKGTTTGIKEGHTTKGTTTGLKEEHVKDTRVKKGVE